MLANVANEFGEDKFIDGNVKVRTPEVAMEEMNKIRGDFSHPYHRREAAGHADAVKYMEELAREAYPTLK